MEKKKGKGGRGLPRRAPRCRLVGARVRAPAKVAVASLLDGGTLTRVGSAVAGPSARAGEGADNGAIVSPFARSPMLLVALREREGDAAGSDLGFRKLLTAVRVGIRAPPPRPLDDGALTHWGACTPARGPATAPSPLALARCCYAQSCCVEREKERSRMN